jgi:phosphoribosylaminoimidazole-succinocarboxamide synthase
VKNHVIDMPDPCVTVAHRAEPFPIEFVVRGYITGSLWRDYEAKRDPYELHLPPGVKKDQAFPQPVLTPSTKEQLGKHDEPVSEAEVLRRKLVSPKDWARAKEAALALFAEGQKQAKARGLILVDTKYEFGLVKGDLVLIDEMHTPDSSRYWVASEYAGRFERGEPQKMMDKENIRQWLINERGFQGHGTPPEIPDDVRVDLAGKYLAAYEQITGQPFNLQVGDVTERVRANLSKAHLI